MHDEEDVIQYYRQFLVFCQPLVDTHKITDDKQDSAFWYGFHPDDREALFPRLIAKHPNQSIDQSYSLKDVYKATHAVFTPSTFLPICNATTGVIERCAVRVVILRRVESYQDFSSVMHKYQVEPRSRLV